MESILNLFRYSKVQKICDSFFIAQGRFDGCWHIVNEVSGVKEKTEIKSEKTAQRIALNKAASSVIDFLSNQKIDFLEKYGTMNNVVTDIESMLSSGMSMDAIKSVVTNKVKG